MRLNTMLAIFIVGWFLGLAANRVEPPVKEPIPVQELTPLPGEVDGMVPSYEVKCVPPKYYLKDDSTLEDYTW